MSAGTTGRDACFAILDPALVAVDGVKWLATCQARAAIRGFELVRLGDGSFIGARPSWGMHCNLQDEQAVERWLDRIGA